MKRGIALLGWLLTVLAVGYCHAGTFIATDRAGYTGTWTRYATLADAQAGINPISNGIVPQRDLALYLGQNAAGFTSPGFENASLILTNWYSGTSNPSNVNYGFFQIYDDDGSTNTAFSASWSPDLQSFHLSVSGAGADAADSARFGPFSGGAKTTTSSIFHEYALDVIFGGLSASYNPVTGLWEASGIPSTISGTLKGIVENVGTNASYHGFYVFDLTINNESWAASQGYLTSDDVFASSVVTPEPASIAVWSLVGAAGLAYRWRRKRSLA